MSENHIGQYKIVRTLGTGGMGTVFLGEHLLLGRRAAIKTLLPALSCHREIVDRFFNEARAISAISDPGVVQIFDFGYHVDGTAYIVMEFLEGESLSARIERLGRLPLVIALRIARQIAHSLGAAHALGIVHRDLKPGNVFLIQDPEAQGGERSKILDFGICKLADTDGSLTQTGRIIGTPVYMSPEQCRSKGRIDHRSDIYSVGCALFHMLTGQPPFHSRSIGELVAAHLEDPPPSPSDLVAEIPECVDALVLRCLEKAPDDRFASMAGLQAALESALASLSDDVDVVRSVEWPSDSWFVDSLDSVTASPITGQWLEPQRRFSVLRLCAFLLALGGGVAAGMYVTDYAMADEVKSAVETPPPPPATEEPQLHVPVTATVRERMPIESPSEPATFTQDVPSAKPVRPPRPHVALPPRPRRAGPVTDPSEDLYDTR